MLAILFTFFGFIALKILNYLAFQSINIDLMKAIPDTRRAH